MLRISWTPMRQLLRMVVATNLKHVFVADSIRWLSTMGVSSDWKRPVV